MHVYVLINIYIFPRHAPISSPGCEHTLPMSVQHSPVSQHARSQQQPEDSSQSCTQQSLKPAATQELSVSVAVGDEGRFFYNAPQKEGGRVSRMTWLAVVHCNCAGYRMLHVMYYRDALVTSTYSQCSDTDKEQQRSFPSLHLFERWRQMYTPPFHICACVSARLVTGNRIGHRNYVSLYHTMSSSCMLCLLVLQCTHSKISNVQLPYHTSPNPTHTFHPLVSSYTCSLIQQADKVCGED